MTREQEDRDKSPQKKQDLLPSFLEEIQMDVECLRKSMLLNEDTIKGDPIKGSGLFCPTISQYNSAMTLRKLLIFLASSNLQVREGTEKCNSTGMELASTQEAVSASKNHLPVGFYIAHGSRIIIDFGQGRGDALLDWLSGGQISTRSAATHSLKKSRGTLLEDKTTPIGEALRAMYFVLSSATNSTIGSQFITTNHKGMNVAMYRPTDKEGSLIADGTQGHLYGYLDEQVCGMLLGIEESAPGDPSHSLIGAANAKSATGGRRLEELAKAADKPRNIVVPSKYNGMSIVINAEQIDKLIAIPDRDIERLDPSKLASAIPSESLQEFCQGTGLLTPSFDILDDNSISKQSSEEENGRKAGQTFQERLVSTKKESSQCR